jgi:SAM-dependent methyltransferase
MDMWALGDYGKIAALIAGQGRELVAAAEVKPGMRVLDVGAGAGGATVPAAATGAEVAACDPSPGLVARGRAATGPDVKWTVADAIDLPYGDGEFDVVLSCIGAMFAPDQEAAARELLRVCRPGGTVAMANWTPDGGAGRFFRMLSRHSPHPGPAPTDWGVPDRVRALLGPGLSTLEMTERLAELNFAGTAEELAALYRRSFPPLVDAYQTVADPAALDRDLLDFFTTTLHGGQEPPGYGYLLVLGTRA